MKSILAALLSLFVAGNVLAQVPACCQKPAGSGFMAMANTAAFMSAHEAPLPLDYKTDRGSIVTFNTLDGKKGRAFYVPSPAGTDKVLILFHEWWGLNDYIKREAVRWQDLLGNVDVYAVDLYDGKVATTPEMASNLSGSLDVRRTDNIIKGALAKAGKNNQIATLGWCLGGSYAFTAAVNAGMQARGCVMYYGFPEKDVKRIKPLQTDVLFVQALQDQFITTEMIKTFQEQVRATNHEFKWESFDAVHAFANPSNPKHNADAAAKAEVLTVQFLKEKLGLE